MARNVKTRHVRVDKELIDEWKVRFPGVPYSSIVRLSYQTSALKIEGFLKQKDVKNKLGRFLYGNAWK